MSPFAAGVDAAGVAAAVADAVADAAGVAAAAVVAGVGVVCATIPILSSVGDERRWGSDGGMSATVGEGEEERSADLCLRLAPQHSTVRKLGDGIAPIERALRRESTQGGAQFSDVRSCSLNHPFEQFVAPGDVTAEFFSS
jgi:hypothetical protein